MSELRGFYGKRDLRMEAVQPVRVHWTCPNEGCGGEMIYNGGMWPMVEPMYHHTCDKCGIDLAHETKHPYISYISTGDALAPPSEPPLGVRPTCLHGFHESCDCGRLMREWDEKNSALPHAHTWHCVGGIGGPNFRWACACGETTTINPW